MSAETLHQTKKGMIIAARNCGSWPVIATLDEYQRSADLAQRETDRAIECWQRWTRRFNPDPETLELGSGRTNVRHEVARQLAIGRIEVVQMFMGPVSGSA